MGGTADGSQTVPWHCISVNPFLDKWIRGTQRSSHFDCTDNRSFLILSKRLDLGEICWRWWILLASWAFPSLLPWHLPRLDQHNGKRTCILDTSCHKSWWPCVCCLTLTSDHHATVYSSGIWPPPLCFGNGNGNRVSAVWAKLGCSEN